MTRKIGLSEKDKAFIEKRKQKQAAKKEAKKRKHKTTLKLAHKEITVESGSKTAINAIKKNAKRLNDAKRRKSILENKLKYKRQKGEKITAKERNKLESLKKTTQREANRLEQKTYELGKNSRVVSKYYKGGNRKNGVAGIIKRTPTTLESDTANSTIYVRIELLTPYLSESNIELGVGEFTTVIIGGMKGHTVAELLQRQTGMLINEDFVIHQMYNKETKNFFGE